MTEGGGACGFRISSNANIHEVIYEEFHTYENGDVLPGVWVTEPVYDEDTGRYRGHTYVWPYTGEGDADGADALYYGGGLYDDGMRFSAPEYAQVRLDCFKTAELLYRHAAGRGNVVAYLCLGYVYYYDRCEGSYWRNLSELNTAEDYMRPYPVKECAFECFGRASEAGLAEGSYKLGDCYKNGIGCEADEQEAFACYERALAQDDGRAFHLSGSIALRLAACVEEGEGCAHDFRRDEQEAFACYERALAQDDGRAFHLSGSIALRLAACVEEGEGCAHDFRRALEYYRRAEESLDLAVRSGDWYYKRALRDARNGVKRCRQEIAFERGA